MKKFALLLFTLLLLAPASSNAGQSAKHGAYVSGIIGGQFLQESDLSSNNGAVDAVLKASDAKIEFGSGFGAGVAAGYHWENGFRLEAEGSYYTSDLDKVRGNGGSVNVDGSVAMTAFMVNALYEFENKTPWTWYVGIGAGYGWAKGTLEAGSDKISETCGIPLVQPIVGVGYWLDDHWNLAVDYRYAYGLEKMDYDLLNAEYRAHRVGLALRYSF